MDLTEKQIEDHKAWLQDQKPAHQAYVGVLIADKLTAPDQDKVVVHPDDVAVDEFAAAMKAKLAKKREEGRGGWDDPKQCSVEYLELLLSDHYHRDGQHIDCANFHMMIWHRNNRAAKDQS